VEDLAEIAIASGSGTDRVVSDVVGPEIYSFTEFVRCIASNIGSGARTVHLSPFLVRGLLGLAGLVVRDVVLTPDEITGLMSELLVSKSPPLGRTRFRDWIGRTGQTLGRTYASEMDRHYR